MNSVLTILLLFTITISFAQENYFVNAEKGLLSRTEPDANAKISGKLPYGSIVFLATTTLEKSSNNGEIKPDDWVKIKYFSYPFIISQETSSYLNGYVLFKYIEPLNKITNEIKIENINEQQFKDYEAKSIQKDTKQKKITDFTTIERSLKGEVTWATSNKFDDSFHFVDAVNLDNGQILRMSQNTLEKYSLTAYYPYEQILLFNGVQSCGDFSISLKTGEAITTVGNPENIITSPNNKIRLNGFATAYDYNNYFFQEIKNNKLIYLTNFGWEANKGDAYSFEQFYWINDLQFVYSYLDGSPDSDTRVLKYQKGTIIKTKK